MIEIFGGGIGWYFLVKIGKRLIRILDGGFGDFGRDFYNVLIEVLVINILENVLIFQNLQLIFGQKNFWYMVFMDGI